MKNLLITGGMGYIGSEMARYFYELGYNVILTKRKNGRHHQELEDKFEIIEIDLLDEESLTGICRNVDVVIHTATFDERLAGKMPKDALLANGYATRQLLEDAYIEKVSKFIYLSTFHVYGTSLGSINESTMVNPISDYAITHYVGEMYCNHFARMKDLQTIIVRLTNGFGAPYSLEIDKWYLALNDFCKAAKNSERIVLKTNGMQARDFVAIKDIVEAVEILVKTDIRPNKRAEVFNVSSQKSTTIRELALTVANVYRTRYNRNIEVIIPEECNERSEKLFVDSSRLRKLGWKSNITIEMEIGKIFELLDKGQ